MVFVSHGVNGPPSTDRNTVYDATPDPAPSDPDHETVNHKKPHSTKRRTVFAGSLIDYDTDSYIQTRQRQTRDSEGKQFTRSKIIALILKERAQDDTLRIVRQS